MEIHQFLCPLFCVACFLVNDFHSRGVFLARGYPRRYGHGKSWARATRHYRKNWSLWQRLLWIPLFKEYYESEYRTLAYLSYIHFAILVISIIIFVLIEVLIQPIQSGMGDHVFVIMIGNGIVFAVRLIYNDAVATGRFPW